MLEYVFSQKMHVYIDLWCLIYPEILLHIKLFTSNYAHAHIIILYDFILTGDDLMPHTKSTVKCRTKLPFSG